MIASEPLLRMMDESLLRQLGELPPPIEVQRSSAWRGVRDEFLIDNPTCAVCDGDKFLEVHHVRPYHMFPDLELYKPNLITLCDHPARRCHFMIGHLGDWRSWNPEVHKTAEYLNRLIRNRRS